MKVKFLADADLNEHIVKGVIRRAPQVDFRTATEAGLEALPDEEVLAIAAAENRMLVTHDHKTMPYHFANFIQARKCFGVILVRKKAEISQIIDDLVLIWSASEAEEYINSIRQIPT